ncbi:MAG: alkaline phosphatase family protein [Sphingomonadales bacterium]
MTHRRKLLVIGLDAFDRGLAQRWMDEGALPNLAAQMAAGVAAGVRNPAGMESGSLWPSFAYGCDPSFHGLYDGMRRLDPETFDIGAHRAEDVPYRPFWSLVDEAGGRTIVIDAVTAPDVGVARGIRVIDWFAHVPAESGATLRLRTHPPELRQVIERDYGPDPLGGHMCDFHQPRTAAQVSWFTDALLERVRRKCALTLDLMAREEWDYFMVVFADGHCAGHHCWHLHDPSHEEHDPAVASAVGDPLKTVYMAIDEALGRILRQAGPEATVLTLLSQGIGTGYTGLRLLDRILARLNGEMQEGRNRAIAGLRRAWRMLPLSLRHRLRPMHSAARNAFYRDGFLPDPQKRLCFETYCNERTSGIRINVAGRDPHGRIQPGAEYDALCDRLIGQLGDVRNDDTGEPLIASVVRTRDLYAGPRVETLPDLLVTWNREQPIHAVSSPAIGRLPHPHPSIRTGDHRPHAMLVLSGPGYAPRRVNDDIDMIDLAPTLASLLDLPATGFQGQPRAALAPVAD